MRKGAFYGLEDYDVREDGTVINRHNNHVVKPQINNKGYGRVSIGGKLMFVHRLVAEKYIPNPENKPQVNHKDGNKFNNSKDNLEWVTNQENRDHAVEHNLHLSGDRCPYSKLTSEKVKCIRDHPDTDDSLFAALYNVSIYTIRDARQMRCWKD